MTPQRARAYAKAVLVPLVTAAVVAWSEHRAAQNKERQDATYAVTAPALKELQDEQRRLARRVDDMASLLADHVTHHPATLVRPRPSSGPSGTGSGAAGLGSGLPVEQIAAAVKLKEEPLPRSVQRAIPATPEAAVMEMKR